MKKEDLKKMLKPLVKECIEECVDEVVHEALFGSGIVTQVVAEVIKGVNIPQLVESMVPKARQTLTVPQPVELVESKAPVQMAAVVSGGPVDTEAELQARRAEHHAEMEAQRSRLEEALGGNMGINIFEGLTPVLPDSDGQSPLGGVDPGDPGINLARIPGLKTLNFKGHIKE